MPIAPQARPLALHQVIDRQHNNVVSSVFGHPADWKAQSELVWNFQNLSFPVTARALTFNPSGLEAVEFFPGELFFWLEPHYNFYQPGQIVQGQAFLPPMSAADAMARWVIPRHRGNRPGLRVVGGGPAAQLAQRIGLQPSAPAEEVCVKVEYPDNGKVVEEELYGVKVAQNVPYYGPQGMTMQINWGFERLFSFRAEKGALERQRETFWAIASSVKVNPLWAQLYARILQDLKAQFDQYIAAGYSQIHAAGQLSSAISANNDALLRTFEQQRQTAAQRSAPHADSSAEGFSDYMRGVETVQDPYWGESKQDANYDYHWTDGSGSYQHSNDPFFNPNIGVGATVEWTLMPKKR